MTAKDLAKERLFRRRIIQGECWIWDGPAVSPRGYRIIKIRPLFGSRQILVHRLSAWVFKDFDLDSPLNVCHTCDVTPCFNPAHLFIGTQRENISDMWAKGRGTAPRKLTYADAEAIRSSPLSGVDLANIYGVSHTAISQIRNYLSYTKELKS